MKARMAGGISRHSAVGHGPNPAALATAVAVIVVVVGVVKLLVYTNMKEKSVYASRLLYITLMYTVKSKNVQLLT